MPRDPQAKIQRILLAAQAEFARAGLNGARVDAIARDAAMNKRLLYHYIGDKEALFDAAVRQCLEALVAGRGRGSSQDWRLLCHAVAAGRAPDFGPVVHRLQETTEGAEAARRLLGATLLERLLPELAAAIDRELPAQGADSGAKPRVKMQPTVRGV